MDDIALTLDGTFWLQLVPGIFVAVLGSTLLSNLIDRLLVQHHDRKTSRRADVAASLDRLEALRTEYQSLGQGYEQAEPADKERDLSFARLENALYIAVAKTADASLMDATKSYVATGNVYAIGELTARHEEDAFFALLTAYSTYARKNR